MAINIDIRDLIYPYFVVHGKDKKETIRSFPGVYRFSIDALLDDVQTARQLGIGKILLFGIPRRKDTEGRQAQRFDSIVSAAVKNIKSKFPAIEVFTDICLCAYTTHGHCGVLQQKTKTIDRQRTLDALANMALSHARAGADWIAPSAMARQQVSTIRKILDSNGYNQTKIMGYSAKFASNFYGPFRDAANSAPRFGDRKAYQLNCRDANAALDEIDDDIKEGADMVMVKPALGYLDIIREAKRKFRFPLAAYNVSGEYAMVKLGARQGLWDEKKMVFEIISSIKRAGAHSIITYHAKDIARWLTQ